MTSGVVLGLDELIDESITLYLGRSSEHAVVSLDTVFACLVTAMRIPKDLVTSLVVSCK